MLKLKNLQQHVVPHVAQETRNLNPNLLLADQLVEQAKNNQPVDYKWLRTLEEEYRSLLFS